MHTDIAILLSNRRTLRGLNINPLAIHSETSIVSGQNTIWRITAGSNVDAGLKQTGFTITVQIRF